MCCRTRQGFPVYIGKVQCALGSAPLSAYLPGSRCKTHIVSYEHRRGEPQFTPVGRPCSVVIVKVALFRLFDPARQPRHPPDIRMRRDAQSLALGFMPVFV